MPRWIDADICLAEGITVSGHRVLICALRRLDGSGCGSRHGAPRAARGERLERSSSAILTQRERAEAQSEGELLAPWKLATTNSCKHAYKI